MRDYTIQVAKIPKTKALISFYGSAADMHAPLLLTHAKKTVFPWHDSASVKQLSYDTVVFCYVIRGATKL